jgi:hypothetical protein
MDNEKKQIIFEADVYTQKKLKRLIEFNRRTISGQLRWMIDQEYERVFDKRTEPVSVILLEEKKVIEHDR